jgi:hypothetical protein
MNSIGSIPNPGNPAPIDAGRVTLLSEVLNEALTRYVQRNPDVLIERALGSTPQ